MTTAITFTKVINTWVVTGPDTRIVKGATVTVTKADGATRRVYIRKISDYGVKTPGTMHGFFIDADEHEAEVAAEKQWQRSSQSSRLSTHAIVSLREAHRGRSLNLARINAQFIDLTTTDQGEFITRQSTVIFNAIDDDDSRTEFVRIKLATCSNHDDSDDDYDIQAIRDDSDLEAFHDDVVEVLDDIVDRLATRFQLTITDRDHNKEDDEEIFWTLSAE